MYILEGNIGTGKSTFLTVVKKVLPFIDVVQEPVSSWIQEVDGASLLEKFYTDPPRWAYTLENFTLLKRVERTLELLNPARQQIFERSIFSGFYCFGQNSFHQGFMNIQEMDIYKQWFELVIATYPQIIPNGFIYLKTDPEIAYQRTCKRSRDAEKSLSLIYLQQIDRRHDLFLIAKEQVVPELKQVPVLVLDCNQEFETNEQVQQEHAVKLLEFIETTGSISFNVAQWKQKGKEKNIDPKK